MSIFHIFFAEIHSGWWEYNVQYRSNTPVEKKRVRTRLRYRYGYEYCWTRVISSSHNRPFSKPHPNEWMRASFDEYSDFSTTEQPTSAGSREASEHARHFVEKAAALAVDSSHSLSFWLSLIYHAEKTWSALVSSTISSAAGNAAADWNDTRVPWNHGHCRGTIPILNVPRRNVSAGIVHGER